MNNMFNQIQNSQLRYGLNFQSFFCQFGLDSVSGQRILPVEMAVSLWQLVFSQVGWYFHEGDENRHFEDRKQETPGFPPLSQPHTIRYGVHIMNFIIVLSI